MHTRTVGVFSTFIDGIYFSLRKKACKYFEQGKGTCPFGGKCLYLHAYPDGTRAEPEKPRKQLSSEGTVRVRGLFFLFRVLLLSKLLLQSQAQFLCLEACLEQTKIKNRAENESLTSQSHFNFAVW